ncbi:MAG: ISKra4 family transposase [Elainellaceae cyanobacterium]
MNSTLGQVSLSQKQGKRLGLKAKRQLSPALEKCCLRLCAQGSFEQAEQNVKTLMGLKVGHSSLHRLMEKADIPARQGTRPAEAVSIDGGKVRVRSEETGRGEWRDYKAVRLHEEGCAAFFQSPEDLQQWSEAQPLSPILTCLGDGHDGVWKVADTFGGPQVCLQRQVLDWYHLAENLYKVHGSRKRLKRVKALLWLGQVGFAHAEFDGLKHPQAKRFQNYLIKHRHRIPNYAQYQRLGLPIGSGAVESTIKQIAARIKITGALWKRENVPRILRLRCAYLNNDPCLSISA